MNKWTAKEWSEVVMAWIVGGLVGRLIGHTFLVGHLGWPEFSGWLSVPIGAVVGWLVVEFKAIVPALKHAYCWTQKPELPKVIAEYATGTKEIFVDDAKEFRQEWNWRILGAVSCGLLCSSWLLLLVVGVVIPSSGEGVIALLFSVLAVPAFMGNGVEKFFRYMDWELETFDRPWRDGESKERREALEWMFCFLLFNPVSAILVCLLVACSYWLFRTLAEVVVWIGRVLWKTACMINSSQRMAAMTGAAIGLSISQIYGFNPVICSGVCVVSGLAERFVFILFERAVRRLCLQQRA